MVSASQFWRREAENHTVKCMKVKFISQGLESRKALHYELIDYQDIALTVLELIKTLSELLGNRNYKQVHSNLFQWCQRILDSRSI